MLGAPRTCGYLSSPQFIPRSSTFELRASSGLRQDRAGCASTAAAPRRSGDRRSRADPSWQERSEEAAHAAPDAVEMAVRVLVGERPVLRAEEEQTARRGERRAGDRVRRAAPAARRDDPRGHVELIAGSLC